MITLSSIKAIKTQYPTGDSPVLVSCNDHNEYICKYMRYGSSAYKLASELIGAQLAHYWQIPTPKYCLVNIKPEHWKNMNTPLNFSAPAIGFLKNEFTVDITDTNYEIVAQKTEIFEQLALIAAFDFWVANEDRTLNNSNMLYDINNQQLISIDYGGIFNTNSFESEMELLDEYDSILCAKIANHIFNGIGASDETLKETKQKFFHNTDISREIVGFCKSNLPSQWNISNKIIGNKLSQLFSPQWIYESWNRFLQVYNQIFN